MGAITTGVMIAATVAQGISQYQQQRGQADIAKEQAKVAIAKGNLERFQQKQESEKVRKAATAQAGRGGGSLTGSALENLNRSMTNAQLDEEMITYNAEVMSANFRQEAKNAKAAATSTLLNTAVSVGALGAAEGAWNTGGKTTSGLDSADKAFMSNFK